MPMPSATISVNANRMDGKARTMSNAPNTRKEGQRPSASAASPRPAPSSIASRVAPSATAREIRVPATKRASTSRPRWSYPNQCVASGGALRAASSCVSGSCGAKLGPKMATSSARPRIAIPKLKPFAPPARGGIAKAAPGTLTCVPSKHRKPGHHQHGADPR